MIRKTSIFFLLCLPCWLMAQNFTGRWEGILTQDSPADTFYYQVNLRQDGDAITGTSQSTTRDGQYGARFQLSGYWDGQKLILQELQQLEPETPKWCVKYAQLDYNTANTQDILTGPWKATGCSPGRITLRRGAAMTLDTLVREVAPSLAGTWTGTLSQSDRDYGFYFELDLQPSGRGTSHIVSEGNGGEATHRLTWAGTEPNITFAESGILRQSEGDWTWCIKSGKLRYRREGSRLVLEGTWDGYLDGHDPETGACASGQLYLEKPVLTEQVVQQQRSVQQPYENDNQRQIKIARVLEVARPNIKLRVWDNGTVDGDIVTLFLNGERILHDHRVSKRKIGIPVQLQQESNFLILHAEDLGDISPNTVAVSVDDGEREQNIILSSNLKESGAVLIRQFKIGN